MRRLTTTRRCWVWGKATPAIWILTKTVGYGSKPTLIIAYLGMNIHKSKLFGGPTEGYQCFDLFWSRAIWFKKLNLASQKNQRPSDGFWSSLGTLFMVCTALWYILLGGWWFPISLQPRWLPERSCRTSLQVTISIHSHGLIWMIWGSRVALFWETSEHHLPKAMLEFHV